MTVPNSNNAAATDNTGGAGPSTSQPNPDEQNLDSNVVDDNAVNDEVDQGGDDSGADKPKGVQKRIGELTARYRNAERDRDHWRDLALRNMPNNEQNSQHQSPDDNTDQTIESQLPPMPTYAEHGFDEGKYQEAMGKWVQGAIDAGFSAREAQEAKQRARDAEMKVESDFTNRAAAFAKKTPDFDQVALTNTFPVTKQAAKLIKSREKGPEILYHLGKNHELAHSLARLSDPTAVAIEIGRIEAQLSAPPVKTTSAPPPINTLSGHGNVGIKERDKMSTDEWLKERTKEITGKR